IREAHGLGADVPLEQDEDVLDTWFSSALWPFSTLGWPEQTPRLKTFYPTSVLVTGFDIIFFWVARMVMMGLKLMDEVPFREIYIHGLVRDADGNKMSKSKGNILDPLDLIDGIELEALVSKRTTGLMQPDLAPRIEAATRRQFADGIPAYGTDALRFTFCSLATTGRDIRFDLGRIQGYRNFCNKIWNAARYVLMNTEGHDCGAGDKADRSLPDRWIDHRLNQLSTDVRLNVEQYRFDLAAQAIYEFTWNEFCDWYLELTKPALNQATEASSRATRHTLVNVLEKLMRITHPLMPFITETIWQRVAPLAGAAGDTIMRQPYPEPNSEREDPQAVAAVAWLKRVVLGVRRIRGEMDIPPGKRIPLLLQQGDDDDHRRLDAHRDYVESLARTESIDWLAPDETPPEAATSLAGDLKLLVPLAGLIDKQAESERLAKDIAKRRNELDRSAGKLNNAAFLERAPAAIVKKEELRGQELEAAIAKLEEQLQRLTAL
ncbi:MAG: valine--tRNA ligase, partial [Gammaproteobacteria bacterium]